MEGWRENLGCFCNFVFISFFSVVVSWDFFSVFVYIQKDFFIKCIWEMLRNILGVLRWFVVEVCLFGLMCYFFGFFRLCNVFWKALQQIFVYYIRFFFRYQYRFVDSFQYFRVFFFICLWVLGMFFLVNFLLFNNFFSLKFFVFQFEVFGVEGIVVGQELRFNKVYF